MQTSSSNINAVGLQLILADFCLQEYQACHLSQVQHVFQLRTKTPSGFNGDLRIADHWREGLGNWE